MQKFSKWFWIDSVVGIVGAIAGIASIFTGIAASNDQKRVEYQDLEDRYGLTPVEKEED